MTISSTTGLSALTAELDEWAGSGRHVRLWLRDDDAVEATPALERLLATCARHAVVPLVAVIPMRLQPSLTMRLAGRSDARVAVHGAHHTNHAPASRKAEEMAPERGLGLVRAELSAARGRIVDAFGEAAGQCYVPPWNRIAPEVAAQLPGLGFAILSTFGRRPVLADPVLIEANTHVDLIDWRSGRIGRPLAWLAQVLAEEMAAARRDGRDTIGVLAHHLAHDETAWATLAGILASTSDHGGARWIKPEEAFAGDRR